MAALAWIGGVIAVLAVLRVLALHRAAFAERRRRRLGLGRRVAARIAAPAALGEGALAAEMRHLAPGFGEMLWTIWRASAFVAAIIVGGLLVILLVDPVLDEPLFSWSPLSAERRAALPDVFRWVWLGLVLGGVVIHAVWVFLRAPALSSRHWLVLHPGGGIEASAGFPPLDPERPFTACGTLPAAGTARASGFMIEQAGTTVAFDYFPEVRGTGDPYHAPALDPTWWHVWLTGDHRAFAEFARRHFPEDREG